MSIGFNELHGIRFTEGRQSTPILLYIYTYIILYYIVFNTITYTYIYIYLRLRRPYAIALSSSPAYPTRSVSCIHSLRSYPSCSPRPLSPIYTYIYYMLLYDIVLNTIYYIYYMCVYLSRSNILLKYMSSLCVL